MEDLIKGELDWHNKVNSNFKEVSTQMADIVAVNNFEGIKADGVSDDSDALQAFFNSINKDCTILFSGTYLISKTITKDVSNLNLKMLGRNATFIINDASAMETISSFESTICQLFKFIGGADTNSRKTDIKVKDFNIQGNDTSNKILGFNFSGAFKKVHIFNINTKGIFMAALVGINYYSANASSGNQGYNSLASIIDLIIDGGIINGGGAGQCPSSYHIFGAYKANISNLIINNSAGYALRINGGTYDTVPNALQGTGNIDIHDCQFNEWGDGQIAVQVTKSYGVSVHHNRFTSTSLNTDNQVDIFNCHAVDVTHNKCYGGKSIFVGHGDLGDSSYPNDLIGTRDVICIGNEFINPHTYCFFFGGDGVVDGNRASYNFIVANNIVRFTSDYVKPSSLDAFIYSFLCNCIDVHDNIADGMKYFIESYYDKDYKIHDNTIKNIATIINNTGSDGNTSPTHKYYNNTLLNSAMISGFEVLNPNGNIPDEEISEFNGIKIGNSINKTLGTLSTDNAELVYDIGQFANDFVPLAGNLSFSFGKGGGGSTLIAKIKTSGRNELLSIDMLTSYLQPAGGNALAAYSKKDVITLLTNDSQSIFSQDVSNIYTKQLQNNYGSVTVNVVITRDTENNTYIFTFTITGSNIAYDTLVINMRFNYLYQY